MFCADAEQAEASPAAAGVPEAARKKRSPVRRKRQRSLEPVREEKVACKKPEYDRNQVRQFMRKQQQDKHKKVSEIRHMSDT